MSRRKYEQNLQYINRKTLRKGEIKMSMELMEPEGLYNRVTASNGVNWADEVNESNGVNESGSVNWANGVNWSDNVSASNGVNGSDYVNGSNGVNESCSVNESNGVNWSDGVIASNGVNESFGIINSFGVDRAIFLSNKPRQCSIFGKIVTEERFEEVYRNMNKLFNGWLPAFNNGDSRKHVSRGEAAYITRYMSDFVYDQNGVSEGETAVDSGKEEAWEDMPKPAIEYITSLPEFDAKIFLDVTGIDINCYSYENI